MIESAFRKGNNYYPQVLLEEEWQYVVKEKKMSKHIFDDIEISDEENFDQENSGKVNFDEEN